MQRLKTLRKQYGWTQREVAEKLGIHCTTYTKYETGASEPNFEMLLKFAQIFDVSTDYLLGRPKQKEKPPAQGGELSEKDVRLIAWFRSLPPEKRKAILMLGEAPKDLDE